MKFSRYAAAVIESDTDKGSGESEVYSNELTSQVLTAKLRNDKNANLYSKGREPTSGDEMNTDGSETESVTQASQDEDLPIDALDIKKVLENEASTFCRPQ